MHTHNLRIQPKRGVQLKAIIDTPELASVERRLSVRYRFLAALAGEHTLLIRK
jgi:hypothetical protein